MPVAVAPLKWGLLQFDGRSFGRLRTPIFARALFFPQFICAERHTGLDDDPNAPRAHPLPNTVPESAIS